MGATGGRPIRLRKQILAILNVSKLEIKATLLIVPNLTNDCVLVIGVLRSVGGNIDLSNNTLTVKDGGGQRYITKMHQEVAPNSTTTELYCLKLADTPDHLTADQINGKIKSTVEIPSQDQERYKDLLWKYRKVFSSQPERMSC